MPCCRPPGSSPATAEEAGEHLGQTARMGTIDNITRQPLAVRYNGGTLVIPLRPPLTLRSLPLEHRRRRGCSKDRPMKEPRVLSVLSVLATLAAYGLPPCPPAGSSAFAAWTNAMQAAKTYIPPSQPPAQEPSRRAPDGNRRPLQSQVMSDRARLPRLTARWLQPHAPCRRSGLSSGSGFLDPPEVSSLPPHARATRRAKVVAVSIAIAVAAATLTSCSGQNVSVPNVLGKAVPAAKAAITAEHLKVTIGYTAGGPAHNKHPHGTVLLEAPKPGSQVTKGTTINLTIQQ